MNNTSQRPEDHKIEVVIGNLLRAGVMIAAGVVFLGGIIYLFRHGLALASYTTFQRVPLDLCSVNGIMKNALSFHGRGLIQLGLLLLIATPVARVFFSIIASLRRRDALYVIVTTIVFAVLIYSLLNK